MVVVDDGHKRTPVYGRHLLLMMLLLLHSCGVLLVLRRIEWSLLLRRVRGARHEWPTCSRIIWYRVPIVPNFCRSFCCAQGSLKVLSTYDMTGRPLFPFVRPLLF